MYSSHVLQKNEFEGVHSFDPERNASEDIEHAISKAQELGKHILLDVGGEWCIWCHRLDEFIESHENINSYIAEHFIVVKINYSEENKNEEVLKQYPKVAGYPHLFVLNTKGELLHSQNTAELELDQSYSEEKLLHFLKTWSNQ